jgi:hypothetical protein
VRTVHALSFFDFFCGVGNLTSLRLWILYSRDEGEGGRSMYKLGETYQKDGFLELRQEGDLYLLSLGDCFDDGGEGVCMPLFSFTKKLSKERVEGLIKYLEENI